MGTLALVRAPTLLIVGGSDGAVIDLNQRALALLPGQKRLLIVPGATHLFEEPGVPSAPFRRSHATGFCTISAAQPGARHKQLFWPPVRAANKTYYLAQNVGEHTPHHGEAMKECFACAVHKRRRRRRS
jgi:fermentation-respiration switch protein FrsA (DUF1100 family)